MDGRTTVKYLQAYIREKDHHPELKQLYFMKLAEEVGELSRAMRKEAVRREGETVKGTVDEELWDVIYYAIALANCYDIDLETVIRDKEALNCIKYGSNVQFEQGR